jgi:hypothetical protein
VQLLVVLQLLLYLDVLLVLYAGFLQHLLVLLQYLLIAQLESAELIRLVQVLPLRGLGGEGRSAVLARDLPAGGIEGGGVEGTGVGRGFIDHLN